MKLNGILALLLCVSVGFNIYLMGQIDQNVAHTRHHSPVVSGSVEQNQGPTENTLPAASQSQNQTQDTSGASLLENARVMLAQARYDALALLLQQHLQQYPDDIPFLMLEADMIAATSVASESLAHYYTLLDRPLSEEQRHQVKQNIQQIASDNIEKLFAIQAWDILATFMEPLWQFAPQERDYILVLAEAYARQQLVSLTEHVLASVLSDDPEAIRIRSLLTADDNTAAQDSPRASQRPLNYERTIPLIRRGDHFLVAAKVGKSNARLLLDTGASSTVLNQGAFERVRRSSSTRFIGRYEVNTAGGPVVAPVYQVESVNVGGYRVTDIAVIVLPIDDFGGAEGLLGMNYLRAFRFAIDQNNNQLMLSPGR